MKYRRFLLFLALIAPLCAQRNDRPDFRPPAGPVARVILFENADYTGDSLVLYPGDSLENLSGRTFSGGRGLNDSISSIRVEGGAALFVYEDAGFRGEALRITENIRDLTGRLLADNPRISWNDRISSLRVEEQRRRPGGGRETDLETAIQRAFQDMLCRPADSRELRYYRGLMIDRGWNERMVRENLRQGDEFRREGVDRIIRRAYTEVLGREPDPSGLKTYRRNVLDKGWNEGDIGDDLRRSEEYRRRLGSRR